MDRLQNAASFQSYYQGRQIQYMRPHCAHRPALQKHLAVLRPVVIESVIGGHNFKFF